MKLDTSRIKDWSFVEAGPGKEIVRLTVEGVQGHVDLVFSSYVSIHPRTGERRMRKECRAIHESTLKHRETYAF